MPIRLKLILTYVLSVLISAGVLVLLIVAITAGFLSRVSEVIVDNSQMDQVAFEVIDLLAEIKQAEDYEPEKIISPIFMEEIDTRLNFFNSGLVVLYKEEYINLGSLPKDSQLYRQLIKGVTKNHGQMKSDIHGEVENDGFIQVGDYYYFYMDYSFIIEDNEVVYFIVTDISDFRKSSGNAVKGIAIFIFFLLLLIILPMFIIIQKDIIKPLKELEKGANSIRKGNLDFTVGSRKHNEVSRVVNSFEIMRRELKKSIEKQIQYEENRKELISSISHDLKTPITSIKGYVEGILDGVANNEEKLNKYLQVIHQKSNDMDHLIDDLFLFSKLDLNRIPFDLKVVNFKTFTQDMVEEVSFEYRDNAKISYVYEEAQHIGSDDCNVSIDQQHLKRVLLNIIQNSMKYNNNEDKQVVFKLTNNLEEVKIAITDNGIGMSKEQLEHAFEMFYRGDEARNTANSGTGLGLAIAKQIVEQHQGKIVAESELNKGTTITVSLKKVLQEGEKR